MSFLDRIGKLVTDPVGSLESGASKVKQDVVNPVNDIANNALKGLGGNPKTGAPSLLNPITDISSGAFQKGLGALGVGGSGGSTGPSAPPTDYYSQMTGPNGIYQFAPGIDPNKFLTYLQSQGLNVNDQSQVSKALQAAQGQGWLTMAFQNQNAGTDPLAQQAMFQNTIKPYLQNITNAEQSGAKEASSALSGIQQQYGSSESPDVKALLGTLDTSINQQAGQDVNYANQAALTSPGITDILDALRAQYINQLNTLTTGAGTTAPAKISAPSTLTAVQNALAG